MKTNASVRGITLVELLVVIVIIGVLAALVIAVVGGVRQGAEATRCASNLRQLGLAARQYAIDNRRQMPDSTRWQYFSGTQGSIAPYLELPAGDAPGMPSPMRCDASHKLRASTRDYERTYSMNRYASGSTGNEFNADFNVPAGAEFASPSKTALFIDGAIGATGGVYWSAIRHTELAASSAAQPLYPHGGSVNVVFVDGHVERVTRGVMTGEHSLSANTSFWRHHR